LPANYVVDDMPAPVDLDVGFASYKSDVKANGNVLHYSREYVVRELDLSPEKSADVSKLMGVITSDETAALCSRRNNAFCHITFYVQRITYYNESKHDPELQRRRHWQAFPGAKKSTLAEHTSCCTSEAGYDPCRGPFDGFARNSWESS
jgi:hypothetical protein